MKHAYDTNTPEEKQSGTDTTFPNPNVALGASKAGWDELDEQIAWGKLKENEQSKLPDQK